MRANHYLLRFVSRKTPQYIVEFGTLNGVINFSESLKSSYFVLSTKKVQTPYSIEIEACRSGTCETFPLDTLYVLDKNPVFRDHDEILHKIKLALLTHRLDH